MNWSRFALRIDCNLTGRSYRAAVGKMALNSRGARFHLAMLLLCRVSVLWSCISQDRPSVPWPAAWPNFVVSRSVSGVPLWLATSPVSIFLGNLGAAIVNGDEFCHRRQLAHCAQVGPALPWRCPGAALNFLTGHSMQALQVFFLHCTGIVRGLS